MLAEQIAATRAFNRLVTQRAGALEVCYLGRERPLAQSRVLFEVGRNGAELRTLRRRLGLDSGYLSRLVHALVAQGLVVVDPDSDDERVRRATLTAAGATEWELIDRRSDGAAVEVLSPLSEDHRERLHAAMVESSRLLRLSALEFTRVDPNSTLARESLSRYFRELGDRFDAGFDPDQSPSPSGSGFIPPRGAFWLAVTLGEPVACGGITRLEPGVAYIKRMWVDPSMRGLGLGRVLLRTLEESASDLGSSRVRLETNKALVEAIRLYKSAGYKEIPQFIDEPYAHHWFEKQLG